MMTLDEFINDELKRIAKFKNYWIKNRNEMIQGGATVSEADEVWPLELDHVDWAEMLSDFAPSDGD